MLSDAMFPVVRNAVRNFTVVGHPRADRLAADHADAMQAIRAALADGGDISGLVSKDLLEAAAAVRKDEIARGAAELERVRKGLSDGHGTVLEEIVARHNLGLPSFTKEWTDQDLVAWWAAFGQPGDALMAFATDLKGWWNRVENDLG